MVTKFSRIQRLIGVLEGKPEGVPIGELARHLAVSSRTVKRYIAETRQAGFSINDLRDAANRQSKFSLGDRTPGHFVPALARIRREMDGWGNPKFGRQIEQVIRWLEGKSRPRAGVCRTADLFAIPPDVYHVAHGPFAQQAVSPDLLRQLEGAVVQRKTLRLEYAGLKDGVETFEFVPYVLSLRVGTLYLIGRRDENAGEFKSLSVKRIRRCQVLAEGFERAPFDPEDYYRYCFGQFPRRQGERPEAVRLKVLAPWLGQFLAEAHFDPPGTLVRREGGVYFDLQMVIKPDFINWVLSLAPDLVPVRPASLVAEVRRRVAEAAGLLP